MAKQNKIQAAREAMRTLLSPSAETLAPGARLRAIREAKGLTQDDLRAGLDVSGPTVNDWEWGKKRPIGENPQKLRDWSLRMLEEMRLPAALALPEVWPPIQRVTSSPPEAA